MNSFDLFGNPLESSRIEEETTYSSRGYHQPPKEMAESVEEDQRPIPGLLGLQILVVACAVLLGIQCFRLQVSQGEVNRSLAEGNSIRLITIPSDRGLIEDSTGTVLAQNTRQLALAINPQTLPGKLKERQAVYAELQKRAGIDDKTITLIEDNRTKSPENFAIKTNLNKEESLLYKEWFATTPGVTIMEIPIRSYSAIPSLGQIIGYVGQANEEDVKAGATPGQRLGKAGIESQYDQTLTGLPGKQRAEIDAFGEVVRTLPGGEGSLPQAGKTLKLSLDSNLQKSVAKALQNAVDQRNKTFGKKTEKLGASAVVLDASNGAVLSMVSLPDYDANLFASGISSADYKRLIDNPANPLLNRPIQGQFPSGSVIKPFVAAAALQAGVINASRVLDTSSSIKIGPAVFPDWKLHPSSNIALAIAQSNDIFFYAMGGGLASQNIKGLGIDNLKKAMAEFGLGLLTGIDLPGEVAGLNPGPEWKEKNIGEPWYIGDTYHQSIGQGYFLTTPLQMAAATAAIANGGTLYQPQLGWSLTDTTTGTTSLLPHKIVNNHWISPQHIATVQRGMEMTTESGGTAQLLGKLQVKTAGKTGTAEFGSEGLTHSWYTGYAPAKNPKYAFAILIEGDGTATESTAGAEPVAEEILRSLFNEPLQPGQALYTQALVPGHNAPEPTPTPSPTPTP